MFPGKQQEWSYRDLAALWELSKKCHTANEIASRLGKTEDAVLVKIYQLGIILKEKKTH